MFSLCLHGFTPGTPGFFPHPRNMQSRGRLIGHSKLCVDDCLSLCQPCDELATCPGCPPPLLVDAETGSSDH